MLRGDSTAKLDTTQLRDALGKVNDHVFNGSGLSGFRDEMVNRLEKLAGEVSDNGTHSFETLVASIRELEDPAQKAQLASLVCCMAQREGKAAMAEKLCVRALNYAEQIEKEIERAAELIRTVNILTESNKDLDFSDSLGIATELVMSLEAGDEKANLARSLVDICGRLDVAAHEGLEAAATPPTPPVQPVQPVPERATASAPGVKKGFVDPAAGVTFPAGRHRRR